MVRAEDETHDVWNDQAHVAHRATDRNGEAGQERSRNINHEAYPANVDSKMHGFFLARKKDIQIIGAGVDDTSGKEEAASQEPVNALLEGSGKIPHQPEHHAAGVAAVHCAHQENNDGGKERSGDDAAEEQRGAVNLALTAAEKIHGGNRSGSSQERTQRSKQRAKSGGERQVRLGDEAEDGAKRSAAGNTEDVRVGEWIAKQRLEAGTGDRQRCSNNDGENDARETNVLDNQEVIAGNLADLAKKDAEQVAPQGIKRNGNSAKLQGDDYNEKQNNSKDEALEKELSEGQRPHNRPPAELG